LGFLLNFFPGKALLSRSTTVSRFIASILPMPEIPANPVVLIVFIQFHQEQEQAAFSRMHHFGARETAAGTQMYQHFLIDPGYRIPLPKHPYKRYVFLQSGSSAGDGTLHA
jgi:hypothetical protein